MSTRSAYVLIGAVLVVVLLVMGLLTLAGVGRDDEPVAATSSPSAQSSAGSATNTSSTSDQADPGTIAPVPDPVLDPAITALPAPQPSGTVPAEAAVPWANPPALPEPLDGPDDPARTFQPAPIPAALASPAGQTAYHFLIAWSQAYLSRSTWETEWIDRWSGYTTTAVQETAVAASETIWLAAKVYAQNVYHPVVVAVYTITDYGTDGTFIVQVATQGAQTATLYPVMSLASVKTWQVTVSTMDDVDPKVTDVQRLDLDEQVPGSAAE